MPGLGHAADAAAEKECLKQLYHILLKAECCCVVHIGRCSSTYSCAPSPWGHTVTEMPVRGSTVRKW